MQQVYTLQRLVLSTYIWSRNYCFHKNVWNNDVSISEEAFGCFHSVSNPPHPAAWPQTCGVADGGSCARGKDDEKIYFLLTWAFPFPALQLAKDHPATLLKPQNLCRCLGPKPGKRDLFPKWSLVLDFCFSVTAYPCWRLSRTFLMGCITSWLLTWPKNAAVSLL